MITGNYSYTYQTNQEFREMFDHTMYDEVRKELGAEKVSLKTNKNNKMHKISHLIRLSPKVMRNWPARTNGVPSPCLPSLPSKKCPVPIHLTTQLTCLSKVVMLKV